tara:strand:- start:2136 stop:2423 length:288 start_codon:yes stop_codon:yes gene_type:complete
MQGRYDYKTDTHPNAGWAKNRMSNSVLEILAHHHFVSPNQEGLEAAGHRTEKDRPSIVGFWVQLGGKDKRNYRLGGLRRLSLNSLEEYFCEEVEA